MESDINIKYIAELSRLELSDEQSAKLQQEMERIVGYIDELKELNVDGVEPTAHAAPLSNVWREDEVAESYSRKKMLENAPGVINENLIKLPRVLPQEEA
ncbi:MAG: Asp-tRNA(Asn)/Glu-tRNA(Gln) amidotransferase subunit GatC [Lentisphaeria bacterium]|nr:Asp-tRNA(Asn)/Glu-tRNA(Gln) amidotransferase subunit GatC [Lentisphaeria bacterium]